MNVFVLNKDTSNKLWLHAYQGQNYLGKLQVTSGLQHQQQAHNFRTRPNEVAGRGEPIPEGEYPLGPLLFAGEKNSYDKVFAMIQSPIWVEINRLRAIGFHLDAGVLGTLGCVGFLSLDDLKKFVNWWNGYGAFSRLYVDWGLKHVKLPDLKKKEQSNAQPKVTVVLGAKQEQVNLIGGETRFSCDDLKQLGLISGYTYKNGVVTLS